MATREQDRGAVRPQLGVEAPARAWARRDLAEKVVASADLLLPGDQALLRAVFGDGRTSLDVARLTGEAERAVRRRIARLVTRICSPRFLFVGRHRQRWPPLRRRVAEAVVLRGLSYRCAADELRLSVYAVRLHIHAVNAMFESAMRAA